MKRILISLCIISIPGLWNIVVAAVPADFRLKAPIHGETTLAAPVRLALPRAVIANTAVGFTDLRILDDRGTETPYVIYKESRFDRPAEPFTWKVVDYDIASETQTIVLERPKGAGPASDLNLVTTDRDFSKDMKVYASEDRLSWRQIVSGTVFDFSSHIDLRKTRLDISDPGDPYLKVVLNDKNTPAPIGDDIRLRYKDLEFTLRGKKTNALRIDRFFSHLDQQIHGKGRFDEATLRDLNIFLDPDGNTMVDLGRLNLPADHILFDIRNGYFYRQIQFMASDDAADGSYRSLTSGVIFKIPHLDETRETMTVQQGRYPFVRLKIINHDNPPLEVLSVKIRWVRRNLYFIPEPGRDYWLFFGAEKLPAPRYELSQVIPNEYDRLLRYPTWMLGDIRDNDQYKPAADRSFRAKIETVLFTLVIICLAIGLGGWAFKLMRKIPKN